MEENKNVIHRKDGITYSRKSRSLLYGKKINLKIETDTYNKLMEIAQRKQITFSKLLRAIFEEYINGENNGE